MDVFCSTSTLRSRKSSSLLLTLKDMDLEVVWLENLILQVFITVTHSKLLTVSQFKHRVSFVNDPWKISCTHVVSFDFCPLVPPD